VTTAGQVDALLVEARAGGRRALGRLITIAESGADGAEALEQAIVGADPPAWIIGIVGAPGVGKSTLTGRLAATAADTHAGASPRVAVIAVDPSSPLTGGAILGDRIRMPEVGDRREVFVRSMAHRGATGGLADAVPACVRVLGAVGVEVVILETVGVGQIELEVVHAADTVIAVVSTGWGDAIQASKAGLLEVADVFVVNKADRPGARDAVRDLEQMLDAGPHPQDGQVAWRAPVCTTVATAGTGIPELWSAACAHRDWLAQTGTLAGRREQRLRHEIGRRAVDILARKVAARIAADGGPGPETPGAGARRIATEIAAADPSGTTTGHRELRT
jgi:LAO/AO transport system kinase